MKKILPLCIFMMTAVNAYAGQASSFEGVYVGINLSKTVSSDMDGHSPGEDYKFSQKMNGAFSGGLTAGYNLSLSENILFGFDLSYHKFKRKNKNTTWLYEGEVDSDYPRIARLDNRIDLKAKLGYVFNNAESLIYVTSGVSRLKIDNIEVADKFEGTGNLKSTHHGWIIGLGGEHFISDKISINIEYLHTNYTRDTVSTSALYESADTQESKIDDGSVRFGLNYWF